MSRGRKRVFARKRDDPQQQRWSWEPAEVHFGGLPEPLAFFFHNPTSGDLAKKPMVQILVEDVRQRFPEHATRPILRVYVHVTWLTHITTLRYNPDPRS